MRVFKNVSRLEAVKLPKRSTKNSAGYDFINPMRVEIPPYKLGDNPFMVATGGKLKCIQMNF